MKKAGMVLGIIGGAISILICIMMLFGLTIGGMALQKEGVVDQAINEAQRQLDEQGFENRVEIGPFSNVIGNFIGFGFGIAIFFGIIGLAGGVLSLIGGIRIEKNNVLSGIFMCVAAVLTIWLFIPFVLSLLGGIFALVQTKPQAGNTPA